MPGNSPVSIDDLFELGGDRESTSVQSTKVILLSPFEVTKKSTASI
jgi:hypothetical protein